MTLTIIITFLISLQVCLCKAINAKRSQECEEKYLIGHHGILTSPNYPNQYPENINCSWSLHVPYNTTITIVVTNLDIEKDFHCRQGEDCCKNNSLTVSNKKFCGTKLYPQKMLSTSQAVVKISFITTENTQRKKGFRIIFSVRNKTYCVGYDLSCLDDKGCYNSSDICNLRYECADHSDEINCAKCGNRQTSCNNHSDNCFDPLTERCDGILNCPQGEDEQNCTEICPSRIPCRNGVGCHVKNQICDQHSDCSDNSDEMDCERKLCEENSFLCNNRKCINKQLVGNGIDDCGDSSDENRKSQEGHLVGFVILLTFSLATSFVVLICRWCSTRRDIHRLMMDLPQFPLPAFRGPGERSRRNCQIQYSESDFLHGGEVYEAFVHTRRRIRPLRRNRCLTTLVLPQGEQRLFTRCNLSCATIALASLGIAPNCPENSRKDLFEKCEKFCEFCHNLSGISDSTNTSDERRKTELNEPPTREVCQSRCKYLDISDDTKQK
ncbi:hypothetical protein ILUMI_26183 [Ignelater luminosus]|uniref:CUB domain-containing protein n=1 Tax=Ignelater luminosus TaxID=2038154 RepID=A0A8K0C409_IGNLU|nr:hypothetical protein ILUMI_26183 [Ignelater luminosus]